MTTNTQILAKIDVTLAKRFKKALIDEEMSFKAWLVSQIREFLAEKEQR